MPTATTSAHVPDALDTLRESFALHLDATRADKTAQIYLAALDALIRHLDAQGMPTAPAPSRARIVESYVAAPRDTVKPTTLSVEFRALQHFWRWAREEEEIDRSPMERMKPPLVPDSPIPGGRLMHGRLLLQPAREHDHPPAFLCLARELASARRAKCARRANAARRSMSAGVSVSTPRESGLLDVPRERRVRRRWNARTGRWDLGGGEDQFRKSRLTP